MRTQSTPVLASNAKLAADWVKWLGEHGRTQLTCYQYGAKLDELLAYLGERSLADADLAELEAWVARPRQGRGQGNLGADSTRNKDMIVLRGLFKWACAHGRLLVNPTLDLELPKVRNELPKAIDPKVWSEFYYSPMVDDVERVVYGLGFFCGLRREEICRLETSHLRQDVIAGFKRKGDRNSHRSGHVPYVSLARLFAYKHPTLLRAPEDFLGPLSALLTSRADRTWLIPWGEESEAWHATYSPTSRPVLPKGMTCPDQINGRLLRAFKRAGMSRQAFTPHALRHSFVTYLLRADVRIEVVAKLANHSSIDITRRYALIPDDPIAEMIPETFLKGSRW